MVDSVSDADWERLNKARKSRGLTTQSEIISWVQGNRPLGSELADEVEREEQIGRATSEKTLTRLRTLSVSQATRDLAEEKLSELRGDRDTEYRSLRDKVFTMTESELGRVDIDRGFLGNAYANSLERAISQRGEELEAEEAEKVAEKERREAEEAERVAERERREAEAAREAAERAEEEIVEEETKEE